MFLLTAAETGGRLPELDDFWTRPGPRAASHLHPHMQERWEIISGVACFRIGEAQVTAGAGEVVVAPPGTPHVAWNPGEDPVRLRIQMRPALRWEEFIERLFALAPEAHLHPAETAFQATLEDLLAEFPREVVIA
ncbi:MAG TPA: cupin domain-containing protein [Solirubrobacteraceae bacterium]